ncbi:hypothetical protein NC651_023623 [Populus alba x Populus x berolinensis]|nr:hypothetical protein NC651_023623 [Populus alba x Populus x berolinensis]
MASIVEARDHGFRNGIVVTGFDGFSGCDDRMERESGFEKLEDERRVRIESLQKKALDTCSAILSLLGLHAFRCALHRAVGVGYGFLPVLGFTSIQTSRRLENFCGSFLA